MAILKDTLIQGDARVTDTLYADTMEASVVTTPLLNIEPIESNISETANTVTYIDFINNDVSYGAIGAHANGAVSVRSKRIIMLCPGQPAGETAAATEYQAIKGVWINTNALRPITTEDMYLGTDDNKWLSVYTNTINGNLQLPTTAGTLALASQLDAYLPLTGGTVTGAIVPGTTNAYDLGSTSLYWKNIYGTTATLDNIVLPTSTSSSTLSSINTVEWVRNAKSYSKITATTSGALAAFATRIICLFPGGNHSATTDSGATASYQSTSGFYITSDSCFPSLSSGSVGTMSLGLSNRYWNGVYSTTGNFSDGIYSTTGNFSDTITIESTSAAKHLAFSRTDGSTLTPAWNYVSFPTPSVSGNGGIAFMAGDVVGTSYSSLIITNESIRPGPTDTIKNGTAATQWEDTFSKQYTVNGHVTLTYDSDDLSLNFNFIS